MQVSAAPFYVFLAAVCLLYWVTAGSRRLRLSVLALANLCATGDFFIGLGLDHFERKATRRLLVGLSLLINVGVLASLKILPLVTASRWQWLFPLSLSFYCFQSLTYTIDIYLGEMQPTRILLNYLSAALFFPSITAGPIPRMRNLLPQLALPFSLTPEAAGQALLLIGTGLVKKLLIADYLANNLVNRVFDTPALYSSSEILIAVYGYALQLFFDFSGYTDIARGAALLLGIDLPENFRRPYLAVNVAEFWRRWHITFSEWLRDYLFDFFPKRRKYPVASYSYAFLLTFVIGGLWHGISWNFLIWGALHGLALGVVFAWKRRRRAIRSPAVWPKVLGGVITFNFVCFAWIFFRASTLDNALAILRGLASLTWSLDNLTPALAIVLIIAAILHSLPERWFKSASAIAGRMPFWVQGAAMAALILIIQTLAGRGAAPFVYGNF
jgi:D-alanyl-lipoteichoic acid acyltransferase DltB (MBOAT superfamily)